MSTTAAFLKTTHTWMVYSKLLLLLLLLLLLFYFFHRYGFNSHGHQAVQSRLEQQFLARGHPPGILGINLGKNKTSDNAIGDYVRGVHCFSGWGDYLVINVSSPNTPGLRSLQGREQLAKLIDKVGTLKLL